jgi:hypothetical protein
MGCGVQRSAAKIGAASRWRVAEWCAAQSLNLAACRSISRCCRSNSSISSSRDAVRHCARTSRLCHDSLGRTTGNCGAHCRFDGEFQRITRKTNTKDINATRKYHS